MLTDMLSRHELDTLEDLGLIKATDDEQLYYKPAERVEYRKVYEFTQGSLPFA